MKKLKLFFALFAMLALGVGNAWGAEAKFGTDWNSVFGTSYSGSISGVKANQLTLSGTVNSVSLVATNGTSTNGYVKTSDWRLYNGYTLTLTAPANHNITAISAKKGGKAIAGISTTVGDLSIPSGGATMSWTGSSNQVVFKVTTTMGFSEITVTYSEGSGSTPTPDPEDPDPENPTPETGGDALSYTWDLSKASHSEATSDKVTWSSTDVNMVLTKESSSTNANNYLGGTNAHTRVYKSQKITFTPEENVTITSIEITATSSTYAGYFKNATWSNGSANTSNTIVTVTPTDGANAVSCTIGTATRATGVTVHYTKSGSGTEETAVKTLQSIAVTDMTQIYQVGDAFSFDGKCTATYSVTKDGVEQAPQTAIVTPTSVSTPDMTQVGTPTVTVTYTEGDVTTTAEYTITIEEAPTYDFRKIEGFDDWGSSYEEHIVEYADAKVTFASADKNGSTITDQPVTKGGDVSLVLTDGMNIATVKWVCTQWTTKAQTITLHYSKDGGNVYTSTEITSSDFTISSDNLPAGTNAVKITFSSTNQVGIKSCTITKVEAAAITQVPAPQFSLQGGAYDGAQSVELTCTMADATIYYTTDGNDPTTSSSVYSTAIQVTESMTIKAYAVKEGLEDSPVVEATYEISAPADVVLDFTTNDTWNFPTEKTVTATDYSNGDYTVTVAGSEGQGFMFDNTNKNLMIGKEGSYIVLPIFNKPIVKIVCEGVSSGSGSVTFNVFVDDEAVSTAVTSCKVDQTFLIAEDKQVANVAHVIKVTNAQNVRFSKIKIYLGEAPAVERPVIAGEEEFAGSTEVSITCATSGAKIYYTTDGTTPTDASPEYTTPFELTETKTVKAIAYVDGQASAVATKTFTFIETITCVQASEIALAQSANNVQTEKKYRIIAYVTETLSGVSSNQQSFKVVDNIGDESVFQSFFCNVSEEIVVGMKVEMIGKLSKYNDAAQMKNGDVTILEKPVAAPKILGADAFETSTEVTITAEEGLKIFYTLNGDDPTTSSIEYSAPFELSATTTVKAIAYNSATAKSSTVAEKTFTKTAIPAMTIAEFIANQGGACYLEGIVSNIANTTYGNFDLTDASGTIYVYGCLNAAGESKKFAELGIKNGDKIKVIADEYELYGGTKDEAIDVQYVSHISAATITIADITMEVGETKTIAATITPDAAKTEVTYSIKAGSDDCITLSENNITAKAVGTATITATIATAADYMGKTVDFTVTVNAKSTKEKVVILAEYEGQWYALKADKVDEKTIAALEVTYFEGKLYNVDDADKALIEWDRAVVDGNATFKNGENYLSAVNSANLTLSANACDWVYEGGIYKIESSDRTFLYRAAANGFKNYDKDNAGTDDYSSLPVVTAPVYATGYVTYTRNVTNKYGTICLPYASKSTTGAIFYRVAGKETGKVYLESVDALEAGVPYIFEKTANTITVTCQGEAVAKAASANGLVGNFTNEFIVPANNYILYSNAFIPADGTTNKVNAYRAYLDMDAVTGGAPVQMPGRRYIGMDVQGENVETGVEDIITTDAPVKVIENGQLIIIRDGVKYNVQGQKL